MQRRRLIVDSVLVLLFVGMYLSIRLSPWWPGTDGTGPLEPPPTVIIVTRTATPTITPTETATEIPERILTTPSPLPSRTLGTTATPSSTVTPDGPVEERPNHANPTPKGTPSQKG